MLALLTLLATPVYATWSIAAVDPVTQEVGVAGATCGPMVWFIAGLVPGEGAVVSQYATWRKGRETGEDRLASGHSPAEVLRELRQMDEDDGIRQYGVVSLSAAPVTFTGAAVEAPALTRQGETWTVQGNTLADRAVVIEAAAVMEAAEGSLQDRLLAALEAGAAAGGDGRCEADEAARSAFLYVARPNDKPREPSVEYRASGSGAVGELSAKVAEGHMSCSHSAVGGLGGLGLLGLALALGRRRAGLIRV